MPLYEYQCEACCHAFEQLVLSKNDEPSNCPQCGANEIKRLMSCTSFLSSSATGAGACAPSASSGFS